MESNPSDGAPPPDGDTPLHELERDALSVFLYVAFTGPELEELVRALRISLPGYRLESLGDIQLADLLADEIRAAPTTRKTVIDKLREIYEFPALEGVLLPPSIAEEVGLLSIEEDATVRMLWRLIADPDPAVRAVTRKPLGALVKAYYAPPPAGAGDDESSSPSARPGTGADATDAQLRKEVKQARAEAERTRKKNDELKEQLKSARQELADLQREAASFRKTSERLSAQVERQQQPAKKTKAGELRSELAQAQKTAEGLSARVASLEERDREHAELREKLRAELEAAQRELGKTKQPVPASNDEGDAVEDLPSTWMLPRFSREFYDSLEGWEPRIQRTAFKRAMLLAENHRHPSLRAIPLEGIPGYFRIRIATDVRLIYRREDRGDVEMLSLIDREDLDRYVRQAKTR